jgi:hypothetical protein
MRAKPISTAKCLYGQERASPEPYQHLNRLRSLNGPARRNSQSLEARQSFAHNSAATLGEWQQALPQPDQVLLDGKPSDISPLSAIAVLEAGARPAHPKELRFDQNA